MYTNPVENLVDVHLCTATRFSTGLQKMSGIKKINYKILVI